MIRLAFVRATGTVRKFVFHRVVQRRLEGLMPARRGRAELSQDLADLPTDRVRLPGVGRPPVEKKIRR